MFSQMTLKSSCSVLALSFSLGLLACSSALADQIPECMSGDQAIPIDNQQVITWKTTTANEYHARGHVKGTVDQLFADATGHHHFEISLGNDPGDKLEVVYDEGFGPMPAAEIGMTVEACGDYITSYEQGGGYAASPSGALIHWVHISDSAKHPSGFLVMNGVVVGQDLPGRKRY